MIKTVRETIYEKWKLRNYPDHYGYWPPFRTCWPFMTSPKFTAVHIHQMRAGRSYLRTHKDWRDPDKSLYARAVKKKKRASNML